MQEGEKKMPRGGLKKGKIIIVKAFFNFFSLQILNQYIGELFERKIV